MRKGACALLALVLALLPGMARSEAVFTREIDHVALHGDHGRRAALVGQLRGRRGGQAVGQVSRLCRAAAVFPRRPRPQRRLRGRGAVRRRGLRGPEIWRRGLLRGLSPRPRDCLEQGGRRARRVQPLLRWRAHPRGRCARGRGLDADGAGHGRRDPVGDALGGEPALCGHPRLRGGLSGLRLPRRSGGKLPLCRLRGRAGRGSVALRGAGAGRGRGLPAWTAKACCCSSTSAAGTAGPRA